MPGYLKQWQNEAEQRRPLVSKSLLIYTSLEEKEALGSDRKAWAYARLGDLFVSRVPAELQQAYSTTNSEADIYIADYSIYAGHLLDKKGDQLFPKDMVLLAHWNLRDEIKADYGLGAA